MWSGYRTKVYDELIVSWTRGEIKRGDEKGEKREADDEAMSVGECGERIDKDEEILSKQGKATQTQSWPGAEPRGQVRRILTDMRA